MNDSLISETVVEEEGETGSTDELVDTVCVDQNDTGVNQGCKENSSEEEELDFQVDAQREQATRRSIQPVTQCGVQDRLRWSGLSNIGNSCYISAVIQCLAMLDGVASYEVKGDQVGVVEEYGDLLQRVREGAGDAVDPTGFKNALAKVDNRFDNKNPQDAQEFLSCMLNILKERRVVKSGVAVDERAAGQLQSTLKCKSCVYESTKIEDITCLSVQVKRPNMLVMDCVDEYLEEEDLSDGSDWKCNLCGASNGRKKLSIARTPDVLVVHLKRFIYHAGSTRKVDNQVGVHRTMEVAGKCYELVGVVKHLGSRESGHYTANIKTNTGWLSLDDWKVGKITLEELWWCSNVYLCFYQAVEINSSSVPDTSNWRGPATSI